MSEKDKTKKEIHEIKLKSVQKNLIHNVLKKIKENNELKSVEVDATTKFINEEDESSYNDYTDDVDNVNEQDRVIRFKLNERDLATRCMQCTMQRVWGIY